MAHLHKQFDDLLTLINVDLDVLAATRERLTLARKLAEQHPEGRSSYSSGSIPAGTPHPAARGCGQRRGRRHHPGPCPAPVGPDGDGEAPHALTDELVAFVGGVSRRACVGARTTTLRVSEGRAIDISSPVAVAGPSASKPGGP